MRKKKCVLISVLIIVALFALMCSACSDSDSVDGKSATAYVVAVEFGYEGTMEEFIAQVIGDSGTTVKDLYKDGSELVIVRSDDSETRLPLTESVDSNNSVVGAEIDADGHLIVKFADGSTLNIGKVRGTDGQKGADGQDGKDGSDGQNGTNGQNGKDGVGIKSGRVDEEGNLIVELTDGTEQNFGKVRFTVYDVYMEAHPEYEGDISQWLDDLLTGKLNIADENTFLVTVKYGSEEIQIRVAEGEKVDLSGLNLDIEGKTLIGWKTEDGEDFDPENDVINADITIIAQYEYVLANEYEIDINEITGDGYSLEPQSKVTIKIDNIGDIYTKLRLTAQSGNVTIKVLFPNGAADETNTYTFAADHTEYERALYTEMESYNIEIVFISDGEGSLMIIPA